MKVADGQPFTKELFMQEPDAAKQFLTIFQERSYNIMPDWSEWHEDQIIAEAIERLEEVEEDLQRIDWIKRFGKLH